MLAQLLLTVFTACSTNEDSGQAEDQLKGVLFQQCPDDCDDTETVEVSTDILNSYLQDGVLTSDSCQSLCEVYTQRGSQCCTPEPLSSTEYAVTCYFYDCRAEGRKHLNIKSMEMAQGDSHRSVWLLRALHCEASSVGSFLFLRKELEALNAPEELLERCLLAARDEINHARMIRSLIPELPFPKLQFSEPSSRSLLELSMENFVEGCIHEAFAALQALWQAKHAEAPAIRAIFQSIAQDELGHAQLAFDLHQWLCSLLSAEEREQVLQAGRAAIKNITAPENSAVVAGLGLPTATELQQLMNEFTSVFSEQMIA